MNDDAVDGFKQRQLDEILPLDETARRRRRGNDQQRVAGVGIDQPMHEAGIGQRHGDIGHGRIGDITQHLQRQRRCLHPIGKCQRPADPGRAAIAFERRHLRTVEAHADGLAFFQRQPADVADDGAGLGADRLDIDRPGAVEHQPHRVGAAEHGRGRRSGEGKRHTQAVAVPPCLDGSGGRFRSFRVLNGRRLCFRRHCCLWRLDWSHLLSRGRRLLGTSRHLFHDVRLLHYRRSMLDNLHCLLRRAWRCLRRARRCLGYRRRSFSYWRRFFNCQRRLLRLPGLNLDPGLFGDRFRCDRRQLCGLLRRDGVVERFAASDRLGSSDLRGYPRLGRRRRTGCSSRGMRGSRGMRLFRHRRLLRLESNVDDVVLLFAEGMHIDFADQYDIDRGRVAIGALGDRGDIRRRRHLGVGQIEREHVVELQRQLLVVEHRRNVDPVGHFKDEADKGRLYRGTDTHRRLLLGRSGCKLGAQRALGRPGPRGQFANDIGRQRRRRTGPAIGQEVDEDPLPGRHGADRRPPRQRQPDRRAIGIAPRRADIVRHRIAQFIDGNIHRPLEADHDDRSCGDDVGLDVLGELQHQPCITAGCLERRFALNEVLGPAGRRHRQAGEQQEGGD